VKDDQNARYMEDIAQANMRRRPTIKAAAKYAAAG
jgi:hypothetical protein